jgi:hypothetical protein
MIVDPSSHRSLFAGSRITDRFAVRDQAAADDLARVFDSMIARDPMNPTKQLVRSSYLAPIDESIPRESFLRVRQYAGSVDGTDTARAATFLELKHVAADGTKHKERVAAAVDAVEQLRTRPVSATLTSVAAAGADQSVIARAARLLDSAPHQLEAATEYGRSAWETADSTLRVTLDDVATAGTSLARDGAAKRVLEIKHAAGEVPGWVSSALQDAMSGGRITRIVPGVYPTAATASIVDDVASAAARMLTVVR